MYIKWREEVIEIVWLGSAVAMLSAASVGLGMSIAWLSQVY